MLKTDHMKRVDFARWILNKRINIKKHFNCSDEAYFYLNGGHNIQNDRIWAEFQPNEIIEQPLHDEKVMVWCAFSGTCMYGPYFFDANVKWKNYLEMLKEFFWPKVRTKYSDAKEREKLYFQQDGAPPHRKKEVQDWLKGKFGDKFINTSRWPPISSHLYPCDFSLWGGLKSKVYEPKPKNLEELKQNITREIKNFQKNIMQKHLVNVEKRLEMVINEKGGNIEHLLK